MAIDWDWISGPDIEGESTHKTGYVPAKGSGFTVGSFDIGQHSTEDIRRIIQSYQNKLGKTYPLAETTELYKSISPYALREDVSDKEARKISFEKEEIKYLTAAKRYEFERQLKGRKGWDELDDRIQTVLASIGWQWGTGKQDDDRNRFEELWAVRDDKAKMENKLRSMSKEGYKHRRITEADYVNPLPLPVQEVLDENNKIGQIR